MTHRQKIGFDDDKVVSNQRTERPDRYKAKAGRQDRVRIMSPLVRCFGATVKNAATGTGFFMYSCADPEDAYAAVVDGDEAAIKRCEAQCPLFKKGYPVTERFACLLYHIESTQGGRKKSVNQPLPWVFAGDKYVALRNIQKTLKVNPRTQKPIPIQSIEILIDCQDDNFQKMTFIPVTEPSQLVMSYKDCLAVCAGEFDPSGDPNGTCGLVEDTIAPESKQSMMRSIERAENGESKEDQHDEFAGGQAPAAAGKRGRSPSRPAPGAEADVDDSGAFDLGEDVGGDVPEVGEAAPPVARRSPAGRPGAKAGGKPPSSKPPAAETPQDELGFEDDIPF